MPKKLCKLLSYRDIAATCLTETLQAAVRGWELPPSHVTILKQELRKRGETG